MSIGHYLVLSGLLFSIGAAGVFLRKNLITLLLSVEIMLNAVNLLLVAFSKMNLAPIGNLAPKAVNDGTDAQLFVFFIMVVAAAEVTVGLAIIVMMYRNTHSVDVNFLNRLKN